MSIPIRVSDELLEDAKQKIKMSYRSLTKQIEFWAQIGKEAEMNMTSADVAALVNGEVEIKVLRKKSEPIDFDNLFGEIESDRKAGSIKSKVIKDKVWYEESQNSPGLFVRINSEGEKVLGKFVSGKFVPDKNRK
jgi:hypothetical protein